MTLHLTCASEVIKLPNKRFIPLFHHFFLQFLYIVEMVQKAHNTTKSRTPVPCILQILTTFNLYSGRPRVGLSVNNKQKISRKQLLRFQKGMANQPPPSFPPGQICKPKWLDHRRVNAVTIAEITI